MNCHFPKEPRSNDSPFLLPDAIGRVIIAENQEPTSQSPMPQGGETKESSTGSADKKQDEVKTSNPVVVVNEAKPETKEGMQLMLGGSSGSGSQPPQQQHSPGSTSSVSSNGSHAGYTRQNNPRPRSYKHSSNSSTGSSAGSTSGYQTTSSTFVVPPPPPQPVYAPPPPPVDYSPGSYAAATSPVPMQQPPPPMHYGYTEMTPAPGCSWVPCGSPYPTYQPSGAPYDVPTIVQAPPPNQASPPAPRGRYTPSPHSVSGSSSPSSFCQTSNSTTTATTTTANGGQHVVNYHVHQGEVISLQLGDGQVQVIPGRKIFVITYALVFIRMELGVDVVQGFLALEIMACRVIKILKS